jgi:uncharacterized protein with FMN-binding domain
MSRLTRTIPALAGLTAAVLPTANALASSDAAAPKSSTKTYTGPSVETGRWGPIVVKVVVKTTTFGTKTTRKIVNLSVPVYPSHTDRSIFINQQAIPLLFQETLTAQNANIDLIGRATDTSIAYQQSLAGALAQAKLTAATHGSSTANA